MRLKDYFERYPSDQAPFMHKQLKEWSQRKPLEGIKVIHHVPLVGNTLLKIAVLLAAGAEVVVTNPSFLNAHHDAIATLQNENIKYVSEIRSLKRYAFDIYFDCGGELFQELGPPKLGAIELTASGDAHYRNQQLDFPVISIDATYTKQLETLFGSAASANIAIAMLTGEPVNSKSWFIFGFGKIGRGLAYYCAQNKVPVVVADIDASARKSAEDLGLRAINPEDGSQLGLALNEAKIVVTATGKKGALADYPKSLFTGKILANMGVHDEFGEGFSKQEVLNGKQPVNFILQDPTPIQFIDPEFYAHNLAALDLLNSNPMPGVSYLDEAVDKSIITRWCGYHGVNFEDIAPWFNKSTSDLTDHLQA